jgi:hypothetical protein
MMTHALHSFQTLQMPKSVVKAKTKAYIGSLFASLNELEECFAVVSVCAPLAVLESRFLMCWFHQFDIGRRLVGGPVLYITTALSQINAEFLLSWSRRLSSSLV